MTQRDSKTETTAAFAVNTSKITPNLDRPSCKHCSKLGHEESSCFELIGYPPRWIPWGAGSGCGRGRGGRAGRGSAGRGRGAATAYMARVSGNETKLAETDGPKPTVPGLPADQIQKLLSLIETPKSGSKKLSGNGV